MGLVSKRGEDDEERGEISIAGLDRLDGGGEETIYELDEWPERGRSMLRDRLETLGVPHRWEDGTTLVVAASDEAWVERIMDQVEDDLSLALDPEVPQVAYDLTDWETASRERLFSALEREAVPYGIDGEELFVHEIDEVRVDELVDAIVSPGDATESTGDGGVEAMGELFVAADRLVHDAVDPTALAALVDVLGQAATASVPYGMDAVWWEGILGRARGLVTLLDVPDADEESVVAVATELRDGLRPYV